MTDKASKIIDSFKTKHAEGFTGEEIKQLVDENNIDKVLFYEKLGVNTGIIKGGDFLTYHCDIELALRCVFEQRDPNVFEWD